MTSPVLHGAENIPPGGPLLLVGNHTIFGLVDALPLLIELQRRQGIVVRCVADPEHLGVPLFGQLLREVGTVEASPENFAALFEAGHVVLHFPGGAREVARRKGEKYRLHWEESTGFAEAAVAHGAPLVPFGAVGGEESYDIVWDADDLLRSRLGPVLRLLLDRVGTSHDRMLPVAQGFMHTPLPKPERLYFDFAPALDPADFARSPDDSAGVRALRDAAAVAVERGIQRMLAEREQDADRRMQDRLRNRAEDLLRRSAARLGPAPQVHHLPAEGSEVDGTPTTWDASKGSYAGTA